MVWSQVGVCVDVTATALLLLLFICAVIARYNAVALSIRTLWAVDLVLACLLETTGDDTKLVLSLQP